MSKRQPKAISCLWYAIVASAVIVNLIYVGPSVQGDTKAKTTDYARVVLPLLQDYCMDCHGGGLKKGGLTLEGIDADLLLGEHYETWRMIEDQVRFGDMPPKGKLQPSDEEREVLLAWIQGELRKTHGQGSIARQAFNQPKLGNYVPHQALFGKRLDRVYPAPPRLWRLRPEIYSASIPHLAGNVPGLANGLTREDHPDFKDYAAGAYLDEASTASLLANAKKIAAALVGERSKEKFFRQLIDEKGPPDESIIKEAVRRAFLRILGCGMWREGDRYRHQRGADRISTPLGRVEANRLPGRLTRHKSVKTLEDHYDMLGLSDAKDAMGQLPGLGGGDVEQPNEADE